MQMNVLFQKHGDQPVLRFIKQPVIDLGDNESMTVVLLERGMNSGEPSVLIVSMDDQGSVVLQTSLDKFLSAAQAMATGAEQRWGWKRPEGYSALMPPDRATQKLMLEQIKKELEEWQEVAEEVDQEFGPINE
jgi:hypothetical protein